MTSVTPPNSDQSSDPMDHSQATILAKKSFVKSTVKSTPALTLRQRVYRLFWRTFSVGLIAIALFVGILNQSLPWLEKHPDKVAAWLSHHAKQSITFTKLETQWTRRGPVLQLHGLHIGGNNGVGGVNIGEAELLVSIYSGILPHRSWTELRLRGLSFTLQRDATTRQWLVEGLPQSEGDPIEALQSLGELQVIGGKLQIRDHISAFAMDIPKINVRLRVKDQELRVGVQGWIAKQSQPLKLSLQLNRQTGNGTAYLAASPIDLKDWQELLATTHISPEGKGQIQLWATIQAQQMVEVTGKVDLKQVELNNLSAINNLAGARTGAVVGKPSGTRDVSVIGNISGENKVSDIGNISAANEKVSGASQASALSGTYGVGGVSAVNRDISEQSKISAIGDSSVADGKPSITKTKNKFAPLAFQEIETHFHWKYDSAQSHGQFELPFLQIKTQNKTDTHTYQWQAVRLDYWPNSITSPNPLAAITSGRYQLQAEQIDFAPVFELARLTDISPSLKQWLAHAQPQASLKTLSVTGNGVDIQHISGEIQPLQLNAVGHSPGIKGLAGHFEGDSQGIVFQWKKTPFEFNWPTGFGVLHRLTLDGTVVAWKDLDGWKVGMSSLDLKGEGYGANVRGEVLFQPDGSLPRLDLAVLVDAARVPVAKKFWVHSEMSKEAIDWLNMALVDGQLVDGKAIISGDLDNWPFTKNNGIFDATARIIDGTIKFQPDWPALQHFNTQVQFVGNGFSVDGKAVLANVALPTIKGGMRDYNEPLKLYAEANSDAKHLLQLLQQSPLQKEYGETLNSLDVSGNALVKFNLNEPFTTPEATQINGSVQLNNAILKEKQWDIAFNKVQGTAQYNGNGFKAENLKAQYQHQTGQTTAGQLSLRAGNGVKNPKYAFESELSIPITAQELLTRAPDLNWLNSYIKGQSIWNVGVVIPTTIGNQPAPPAELQLSSLLFGTELNFPIPLKKTSQQPLATKISAPLPLGTGQVEVSLGQLLTLRTKQTNQQTGIRVELGGTKTSQSAPDSGLIITGQTPSLDAIEWARFASGDGFGEGISLQKADIAVDSLLLLGGKFANTRVQLNPLPHGLLAQLQGDSLAGEITLPEQSGSTITGQLSRLFWPEPIPATPTTSPAPIKPTQPLVYSNFHPNTIPPLIFTVDEVRWGNIGLGQLQVQTQPTAQGLHIQTFQLKSAHQNMQISGDWNIANQQPYTVLNIGLDSKNFGEISQIAGMKGQLNGGQGQLQAQARWNGSPEQFALAQLQGNLSITMKDGQLLEVEPGAGRVLGLLSVAQLPRRVMLDFRDLFAKGLTFNKLQGQLHFADSKAHSDKFLIEASAANIDIQGSANLATQEFDQTIHVFPKSGNLLAVVGAVTAGPVGAALGAATNAVLKKPLGELGSKTYRVTGPWKDPKVDVVSSKSVSAAASAPIETPSITEP